MEAEDPKVRLANDERMKGYTFSDEEDEYNYYTDGEDEEFNENRFYRLRAFFAILAPIVVSAAGGVMIAKQHAKKNQCEAAHEMVL